MSTVSVLEVFHTLEDIQGQLLSSDHYSED